MIQLILLAIVVIAAIFVVICACSSPEVILLLVPLGALGVVAALACVGIEESTKQFPTTYVATSTPSTVYIETDTGLKRQSTEKKDFDDWLSGKQGIL